jgi:hypothetical protein
MADDKEETSTTKDTAVDEATQQSLKQALTPDQKHKNYLADLERLHRESKINESGRTAG